MDLIDHQHFYQWLILVGTLIILGYAALKIKNEPDQYEKTATQEKLGPFYLRIPSWWGKVLSSSSKISFQRTDTNYDWIASFEIISLEKESPMNLFNSLVKDLSIQFDQGFEQETFKVNELTIIRHEGMASENGIKRVYMDIVIAYSKNQDLYLRAISRSSILNGCVEGPYFEKVVQNLELHSLSGEISNS